LSDAVAQYVEVISVQHGVRLEVLLARTGLSGRDPISGGDAGRMLGVSYQRIYQLEQQLANHRTRTAPPAGVWMPQVAQAERTGWPDGYTEMGIAAVTRFVTPQQPALWAEVCEICVRIVGVGRRTVRDDSAALQPPPCSDTRAPFLRTGWVSGGLPDLLGVPLSRRTTSVN
jgi:hypothetical protein